MKLLLIKLLRSIGKTLFTRGRAEATLIILMIIFTIIFMDARDLSAYQTEEYIIHEGGMEFTVTPPETYNWKLPRQTFFTSYNPERGQTDNSPCIGANGTNVCQMAKDGIMTIALSQDMVGRAEWKEYHYGEKVMLYSNNSQCQGIFQIEDTMNKRYTNRGDLFQPTRDTNTSCWVTVTKL